MAVVGKGIRLVPRGRPTGLAFTIAAPGPMSPIEPEIIEEGPEITELRRPQDLVVDRQCETDGLSLRVLNVSGVTSVEPLCASTGLSTDIVPSELIMRRINNLS